MLVRLFLFLTMLALTSSLSCSENIPDCPSRMCIVSGQWRLTQAFVDDELYTDDISQFKLALSMPEPVTSDISIFNRTQSSGTADAGSWSLVNDETILRLVPNDNQALTEDWIIESMTPRQMVLVINRDVTIKGGPGKIAFVLEPF
jgi:hypothetical protein